MKKNLERSMKKNLVSTFERNLEIILESNYWSPNVISLLPRNHKATPKQPRSSPIFPDLPVNNLFLIHPLQNCDCDRPTDQILEAPAHPTHNRLSFRLQPIDNA